MIGAALARRLIDSQFPAWSDLPIAPAELQGWDNRSFRLGPELLVRLPSAERYAAQVDKEQRWLPVLAPQVPLPIPTPVAKASPTRASRTRGRSTDGSTASPPRCSALPTWSASRRRSPVKFPGDRKRLWAEATATSWERDPVWFHGDVAPENLLVRDGRLEAVLDFGLCAIGDPACDTVIAWTFLSGASRKSFRAALGVDADTWSRGRGWALWKALISLIGCLENGDAAGAASLDTKSTRSSATTREVASG